MILKMFTKLAYRIINTIYRRMHMKRPDGYNGYEGGAPYWVGPGDRKIYDYNEYLEERESYYRSQQLQKEQEEQQKKEFQEKLNNCNIEIIEKVIPHDVGENLFTPLKKKTFKLYRNKLTNEIVYKEIIY